MTRFIGFEYILPAAARRGPERARRDACLAGGAQLHTRANMVAIGGQMDTSSMAEDTVTTFETQKRDARSFRAARDRAGGGAGRIVALWKQRLRWARGNVQVTRRFKSVWFRPQPNNRLGSISFGLLWFCLLLLPVFMVLASASLVTLFFVDYQLAWTAFHFLWLTNVITYIFITSFTLAPSTPPSDGTPGKKRFMFPGRDQRDHPARRHPRPASAAWIGHELATAAGVGVTYGGGGSGASSCSPMSGSRPAWGWPSSARSPSRGGSAASWARCSCTSAVTGPCCAPSPGRLHQGIPARRGDLGQDREDGEDGGADMSGGSWRGRPR